MSVFSRSGIIGERASSAMPGFASIISWSARRSPFA
jgi:hypothetical protein